MNDRAALFANVLNQPADDTVRLVLADWLEENGEEGFGQFLRAGVIAARFRNELIIDDPDYYAALARTSALAKAGQPALWVASLGLGLDPLTWHDWGWDSTADRVTIRISQSAGVFTRGLLSELKVTLDEWYAVAPAALAKWPIECVRVSDVPGLFFEIHRLTTGWRLLGHAQVVSRRNLPSTGSGSPAANAPGAVLVDDVLEWTADQFFADRTALVADIAKESAAIMEDLLDAAEDRRPRPPRRQRRM